MDRTASSKRIAIIGAGIVGSACAFFLARSGFSIHLIDAAGPAAGASGASDGAISVASKRPGPLMNAASAALELYGRLTEEGVLSGCFHRRPTYLVAQSSTEAEMLSGHTEALATCGVEVEILSASTLRARCPVLSPALTSAAEVRSDGHALGYEVTHRLITASGVRVDRGNAVEGLVTASRTASVAALQTRRGTIKADAVILAAGGGSVLFAGLKRVLMPRAGQLLVTERGGDLVRSIPGSMMSYRYLASKASAGQAIADASGRRYGLVIDPLRSGQLLIGGSRQDTDDTSTNLASVRHLLIEACALMPAIAGLRLLRSFAGIRTATVDGIPLIGRLPGFDNLFVATGFEGDGICLGPLAGYEMARMIAGLPASIDLSAFDPSRFFPVEAVA